ncbi:MAG: helix-turn-helix domain-containing protein [Gammaproteobacteria bacterium]|nr:helix-turn-helix domain-containing protein [Gammaproteobacteria bacterium]MDE0284476.1 helix-turn-helix domain-containing protein [Gammaproteobacteria bacterium]MDE0511198.1 helix-turn-helix domain-containing protein [Gammaproteobacteria bacterium]
MRNYRTIRYRLLPETGQNVQALVGLAGACRYVWNYFPGANKEQYNLYRLAKTLGIDGVEKPPVTFFSLGKAFIELRNSPGGEWLKGYHEAPTICEQDMLLAFVRLRI